MKEIDATRITLKCMEMVEGTGLKWYDVIRLVGCSNAYGIRLCSDSRWRMGRIRLFDGEKEHYEIALGIVEGKPVWEGDELYYKGKLQTFITDKLFRQEWSWNPPKPKTMMVEFLVEDVEYYANEKAIPFNEILRLIGRRAEACRDALEKQK